MCGTAKAGDTVNLDCVPRWVAREEHGAVRAWRWWGRGRKCAAGNTESARVVLVKGYYSGEVM